MADDRRRIEAPLVIVQRNFELFGKRSAYTVYASVQTIEHYLGCKQRIRTVVNDRIGIEPNR